MKRWSSTLLASAVLFLLNWAVWAYTFVIRAQWDLSPVGTYLMQIPEGPHPLITVFIALFFVIVSVRMYLYLLLLEHDKEIAATMFEDQPPWVLKCELPLRCCAIVAINFIYYSAMQRIGNFAWILVLSMALVFLWDLLMIKKLAANRTLKGVHFRDFFVFALSIFYLYLAGETPMESAIGFLIFAVCTAGIFLSEVTIYYWPAVKRIVQSRSLA